MPVAAETAKYRLEDFSEGLEFTLTLTVAEKDVDAFAALTGDVSPLHVDADFARSRGFDRRVVHGALIAGYISRLVGVHFPGENCILQSANLSFTAPVYVNDTVGITAVVDQVSEGTGVAILKIVVRNDDTKTECARGKVQIGFTERKSSS